MIDLRSFRRRLSVALRCISASIPASRGDLKLPEHGQHALDLGAPRFVLFDEPAAGLSPAERLELIQILTSLPAHIGYIIIEHDMDVALRVAEWVTMMHDGKVIVEGTPAEIRANELVHDLYLGSAHH